MTMWYMFPDKRPAYSEPRSWNSLCFHFDPMSSYTIDLRLRILLSFVNSTSKAYPVSMA